MILDHTGNLARADRLALPWWQVWLLSALACLAICAGFVFAAPRSIVRQVSDTEPFFYGLGVLETSEAGSFRWSGADWGVALWGQPWRNPVLVTLHASATRPADTPEAGMRLVGSPASGAFAVKREPRRYFIVARPTLDGNNRERIMFTGTTFTPPESDGRALGVAITQLGVAGLGSRPLIAMLERSFFFAAVALLVGRALGWLGVGRIATLATSVIVACALGWLHWRNSQSFGFLLPTVWGIIAGAGALLLVPLARTRQAYWHGVRQHSPTITIIGCATTLAGTVALWLHAIPQVLGLSVAISGALVCVIAAPTNTNADAATAPTSSTIPWAQLTLISLAALALRLFRINDQPLALWRDEVYHAELALRIWNDPTFRPIYVPDVDLPALLFYLLAPPIGMFGADLWTLRIMPALAGALTPLVLWWALEPMLGRRVALAAAWCMAVATWSIYMSRWAFPVIFDPLLTLVAIGCLWRSFHIRPKTPQSGKRTRPLVLGACGGACTGLVLYTYHTGRLAPLIISVVVLAELVMQRRPSESWQAFIARLPRGPVLIALIAFGMVAAPLVFYALSNQQAFSKRFDRVSIFRGPDAAPTAPLTIMQQQLGLHAEMWHVRGDANARHYAASRPMLDPFSGALLLVGVGTVLLRRKLGTMALLAWLMIGLVPGIFSDVAPHAMRTIGALVPTCALVAVGFDALARSLKPYALHIKRARFSVLLGGVLLGMLVWNATLYYGVTSNLREFYYHFETQRSILARAARFITQHHPNAAVYLPDVLRQGKVGQTTTLLLNNAPVGWFEGDTLDHASTSLLLMHGDADQATLERAEQAFGSETRLLRVGPLIPFGNQPIYRIYGVGSDAQAIANGLVLP